MSRILLVNNIIRAFAPPNNPPLGVMYLASVLEEAGHHVDVCDLNANRWMINDREYWLKKYLRPYDFIGLSGLIVTYHQQRWVLDWILKHMKELGNPVLMSGGSLASSVPEFTLRKMPELDLAVRFEGERTILKIVDQNVPLSQIPGIAYWSHGEIVINEFEREHFIDDLDTIPFPAWHQVPMEEVYLGNPIWGGKAGNSSGIEYEAVRSANMVVSRGCPAHCGFCFHYCFGKHYRTRSVENVMTEIEALKLNYDIDFIGFVDDNTTANRHWLNEFCDDMILSKMNIKWGCSATVHHLKPEDYKLMAEAGCLWVGFGIETIDQKLRERMHKKGTEEDCTNAVKWCREAGMWANTTYVLGYPGETWQSVRATAKWMRDNDCLNSVFFASPYPGTELHTMALPKIVEKYGSEDAYIESLADATDFRINLVDEQFTDDQLIQVRRHMMKGMTSAIERSSYWHNYNEGMK